MSYLDMTFCPFHESCLQGPTCERALTKQVEHDAVMWWGSDSAPISVFVDTPHCFEEKKT